MPTADPHEFNIATRAIRWFPVLQRAATEAYAGNGIQSPGDLAVAATATDLEIDIAAGTAIYNGSTASLGAAVTKTLSGGGTDPRYDTVAFDAGTASVVVREGTAESNPVPPDLQGDEVLLAVVFVAAGATDVADADIYNWRSEVVPAVRAGEYPFVNADLANSSVTVAGNSVSLGASTAVAYPDLSDTASSFPIPNGDLANSSVTVAGNPVGLGGSTGVDLVDLATKPHSALDDAPAGAHHVAHEQPGDQPATGDIMDGKANTIYSYGDGWVPREQVDDEPRRDHPVRVADRVQRALRPEAGQEAGERADPGRDRRDRLRAAVTRLL
jgi:hypothetical protein